MKDEYQKQVQKLVKLVDGGTDAADFIRASGWVNSREHTA
jgi:hypothetical protein